MVVFHFGFLVIFHLCLMTVLCQSHWFAVPTVLSWTLPESFLEFAVSATLLMLPCSRSPSTSFCPLFPRQFVLRYISAFCLCFLVCGVASSS